MKKYIVALFVAIIIIGIVVGGNNHLDLSNLVAISFSYKYFIYIFLTLLSGITLSYIGVPLFILILIYEVLSCGIVTSYFVSSYAINGLLFSLVYLLIFKIIYWFLLLLLSFYSLKLIKNNYVYLSKRHQENKNNRKLYLKKMLIIGSFVLIFNVLIVTLGNKICKMLNGSGLW